VPAAERGGKVSTQYGTWDSYVGVDAIALMLTLLAVGALFAYLGTKLKTPLGMKGPGRAAGGFILVIWGLSIVTFLVAVVTYGVQLFQEGLLQSTPSNPVTIVTALSALATFLIIAYATRGHGLKLALGSAFVGAASGPMIFELPFDLIVMERTFPPIPPYPLLYRLLFFLPLFIVEISTFSLLTLSPLTKLSKLTMFSLAGMFFVFAVWASLGFAYPSEPVLTALNDLAKILSFITAITLFVNRTPTGTYT
jgi:hypothetical protein